MPGISRGALLAAVFGLSAIPAHAANLPLFDPNFSIVPACETGGPLAAGAAIQFIQNIMNAAISLGVVFFLFILVYAGFLFISSPTNPEAKSKARSMLANAVIGFVITLAGWLIVDYLMKLVYDSNNAYFGPWNSILVVDEAGNCIQATSPQPIPGLPSVGDTIVNGIGQGSGVVSSGGYGAVTVGPKGQRLCDESNPACSVRALMAQGLTEKQAQAMSCIAVSESSGNPSVHNTGGSGACGTFQILAGHSDSNWFKPSLHSGGCSSSTACTNASCNLQTAVIMFQQSGYSPWICKNCNAVAHQCVANFDPGHGE